MQRWHIALMAALCATAANAGLPIYDERPAKIVSVTTGFNYERRIVDVRMRDGVTLHTVIVIPMGAKDAPILLTRTPYDAEDMTSHAASSDMRAILDGFDNATDVIVDGGYIRVIQDIRGRFRSGGTFITTRPLAGTPLNPSKVDEATDAYDTIDWLVKHVPESNGRVGVLGVSYDGFETLMALVNPHHALKVAVPMNPMVDGWRGDDWYHNGAYRQMGIPSVWGGLTKDSSAAFTWSDADLYDAFLKAGSAGEFGRAHGLDQDGFWHRIVEHPAYDAFWEQQAMDKILARQGLKVPMMLVHSLWDQEDIYGASAVYRAVKPKDVTGNMVYLSLGPWSHGQENEDGSRVGNLRWDQDSSKWWRKNVLAPFLAHYLKDVPMDLAPVTAFQSGTNVWQRLPAWPASTTSAKLYLKPDAGLGFDPASGPAPTADYVSDPAHPVTFVSRPFRLETYDEQWRYWLTTDQRNAAARPDVLSFTSPVLTSPVTIAGRPMVHLTASTSGTDSDWVVKLIDVYPDHVTGDHAMGGYQLGVAMDIFRGRYRQSLVVAAPIQPDTPLLYAFALPDANHVFLPGHRIMVQIQSTWFPLYDRNPQTFVPSILFAKTANYVKATQKVTVAGAGESYIELPIE